MITAALVDLPLRHSAFARVFVTGINNISILFLHFELGLGVGSREEAIVIIGGGLGGQCESTCCAFSSGIMSGLFEEAYLDGSQLDCYQTDDEFRNMSEMFDLDGASQARDDSGSRVVSGDYELPVLLG